MDLQVPIHLDEVFYEEPWSESGDEIPNKELMLKEIKKICHESNHFEQLYLISPTWVKKWVMWMTGEMARGPSKIYNDSLYLMVEDNKKDLILGKDGLLISQRLWDKLYGWYGGGPVLKWKITSVEPS